ncbi:bacteriohemerythrin [Magnetospirillum fulvum]|nr:hemerythrin domain-containing protein [Magnetospirillum fulvum]
MADSSVTAHLYPKWNRSISVGDAQIDREHEEIFDQIILVAGFVDRGDAPAVLEAIDRLLGMLERHFAAEERFFALTSYPHTPAHKIEHRVLCHMARHIRGAVVIPRDVSFVGLSLRHFVQAMVEHIIEIDLGYRDYLHEVE